MRRDTEYIPVFSPNAGKYGPEKSKYEYFIRSAYKLSFSKKTSWWITEEIMKLMEFTPGKQER